MLVWCWYICAHFQVCVVQEKASKPHAEEFNRKGWWWYEQVFLTIARASISPPPLRPHPQLPTILMPRGSTNIQNSNKSPPRFSMPLWLSQTSPHHQQFNSPLPFLFFFSLMTHEFQYPQVINSFSTMFSLFLFFLFFFCNFERMILPLWWWV